MKTLTLLIAASTLSAATVNFDTLGSADTVTTQYASDGITFAAPFGATVRVAPWSSAYGTSEPNAICSTTDGLTCEAQMHIEFAAPAVDLGFVVGAIDNALMELVIRVNGGDLFGISLSPASTPQYTSTQHYTSSWLSAVRVNLNGSISSLDVISTTDPAGLVFDDFSFTMDGLPPTGVPEPSTMALMGAALIAMRMVRR